MYKTDSLPLASYLYSKKDLTFKGVNKDNPNRIAFLFEPVEIAQGYTDEYYGGRGIVNPLELFKNYSSLKDLVFEVKRNSANNK